MLDIKKEHSFILITNIQSALQGLFYLWSGFQESFSISIIIMVVLDFAYIPVTLFYKRKGFFNYLVCFAVALLITTNLNPTELFNNFSALLCLFIAILIFPKSKKILMAGYMVLVSIAFVIIEPPIYEYFIHITRSIWIFTIYDFVIYASYNRKQLVIYDDERIILDQLCENKLQKEVELNGMSESTIRRRLDSAKKRNGINNLEELKERYLEVYKNKSE